VPWKLALHDAFAEKSAACTVSAPQLILARARTASTVGVQIGRFVGFKHFRVDNNLGSDRARGKSLRPGHSLPPLAHQIEAPYGFREDFVSQGTAISPTTYIDFCRARKHRRTVFAILHCHRFTHYRE
jgi:hypothetical protein